MSLPGIEPIAPVMTEIRNGQSFALVPTRDWQATREAQSLILQCEAKGATIIPNLEFAGIVEERRELRNLVWELAASHPKAREWINAHPAYNVPRAEVCIEDAS